MLFIFIIFFKQLVMLICITSLQFKTLINALFQIVKAGFVVSIIKQFLAPIQHFIPNTYKFEYLFSLSSNILL